MRRVKRSVWPALAGLVFVTGAQVAEAGVIAADALPLPNRLATADLVVVGKVTAIADKTVFVAPVAGAKNKSEFKVATMNVGDTILPAKGVMMIQIGFMPIPAGVFISPRPFQATVGQEGCFFLMKTGQPGLYLPSGPLGFVDKNNPDFNKNIALLKRCSKLLEDPNASLKSKDAEDRFLVAAMLIARYVTRSSPTVKSEPIDAEQSKLILQALASADWTPVADFTQLSPRMVLNRLPLTAKDGWMPPAPKDAVAYANYARQWLRDHADTYRIQRFVADMSK